MNRLFCSLLTISLIFLSACASSNKTDGAIPDWYISSPNNNNSYLYGVGQGYSLENATKSALENAASKLMVTISSTSSLLIEESRTDVNEEMRKQISQNIEKINFTGFEVEKSKKITNQYYILIKIPKTKFVKQQEEGLLALKTKISNLDKNSLNTNPIKRRNALTTINSLTKELEIKARILNGAGVKSNLDEILKLNTNYHNQLDKFSNEIEFYLTKNGNSYNQKARQIVKNALNKEKITVTNKVNSRNKNQIILRIDIKSFSKEVYGNYMTRLDINFNNIAQNKTIASKSIQVTGGSVISKKQSAMAALKNLEEKIKADNILKTIGIID